VALAALGLAAVAFQRDEGFDLRSRCAFVPEGALQLEIVSRDGETTGPYGLTSEQAGDLLEQAATAAADAGMPWTSEPVDLVPAPKLVDLIRRSRAVAVTAEANNEES
jgi:CRISPR-associated protein Csb1